LHEVLDGKVLIALDGKVLDADNGIDGDPNLVNLVLSQKRDESFHVTLLKLHRELFVVLEHFSNQETWKKRKGAHTKKGEGNGK